MNKRQLLKMFSGVVLVGIMLGVAGYVIMHTAKFGAFPEGARLQRLETSPNYRDGEFRNLEPIPSMTSEKKGTVQGLIAYLTSKKDRPRPKVPVPTVKTDLKALNRNENVVIWLGHSSFFIQLAGYNVLVDPVFSKNAAPVPFANQAFEGTNIYTAEDMPEIDILLITHDHWDHLDAPTVLALQGKIAKIVCPLGVGAHFERWGFAENTVVELDWQGTLHMGDTLAIHALPARHYSGRSLTRNKTLWAAYALITPQHKLYLSGDSGYGSHFAKAGAAFGGFDLAVLDSGQYSERWPDVHMMPEDAVQAAADLQAKALLPAHVGKFSISSHAWDDPFNRLAQASQERRIPLFTPKIGEPHQLDATQHTYMRWWKKVPAKAAE